MSEGMARGDPTESGRDKVVEGCARHLKEPGFYSKGKGCVKSQTRGELALKPDSFFA